MTETEDFHKAKRKLLLRTCCRITAEVFLFLLLLSPFWIQNWNERIPLSAQNSIELPTLSPAAFGSHKNLSDSSYFSYYTSFLAPVQYEIFQISDDFYLDTQYFQCQSEFLSESIGKTYLMTEADNNLNKTETQTLADGTKLEYRAKDFQNYLVIQKGSRILLLKSYTEIDLWENREKFLPLLDKTYSLPEET